MPTIPMLGSSPEEAIDKEYEMINGRYQRFMQSFESDSYSQEVTDVAQQAIKMRGYIIVDGKDEDDPNGERLGSLTLNYVVKEEFVGNIIISNYFDLEKQRCTEEKDYLIHTISNGSEVMSISGHECVETSYGIPSQCTRKEYFSTYEKDSGNEYPGSYQDVLMGNSEGNKVKKPTYLKKVSDYEIEAMGIKPYINYKELCEQGKCAFSEVGEPKVELIDGYKGSIVFQVLDQFGLPIEKAMFFRENRWVIINKNKINIPSEEESDGQGQKIPIYPDKPDGPSITMYSGNGTTHKGGKIIDELAIAFPKGTSGMPKGLDITVHQDIYIFDCFVEHVIQHYSPIDATSTLE